MRHTPNPSRPWAALLLLALPMFAAAQGAPAPASDAAATDAAAASETTTAAADAPAATNPPAQAPPTAQGAVDPATQIAETEPLATRSLILDFADGAQRAIAVGERGHILISESRRDWRQAQGVPTRSTLTAVAAVGDRAWAVGHDGVIVASSDGGQTWQRQRAEPYDPDDVDDLHNGVPLLDVMFTDANNGVAIGAYSLMLKTSDGGATWLPFDFAASITASAEAAPDDDATGAADGAAIDDGAGASDDGAEGEAGDAENWNFSEEDLALEDETDPHLNAIARTGDGSWFIVGERGVAFRSTDSGNTWQRLSMPYQGSMFGVLGFEGQRVLAYGLRGHVFESENLGADWTEVETGTELSLMGGVGWAGGGAALVGANGVVLTRSAAGANLLLHTHPDNAVLAAVLALAPNGELVVGGENGVSVYKPN